MKLFLLKLKKDSKGLEELALSLLDEKLISKYKKRSDRDRVSSLTGLIMLSYVSFKRGLVCGDDEDFSEITYEDLTDLEFKNHMEKGMFPSELIFGKKGKPRFSGNEFYFNISHSGNIIILATHKSEVGADIQIIDDRSMERIETIAKKVFSDKILSEIKKEKDTYKKREIFYKYWTLREAYIKKLGESVFSEEGLENLPEDIKIFKSIIRYGKDNYCICVISD